MSNPQHEPTMEEILASIRKIISEDQPEGAKPAPQPEPVAAPMPEPVPQPAPVQAAAPAPAAPPPAEADVLDLTDEVPDEAPQPSPAPLENDVVFEAIEETAQVSESVTDSDDLISDTTRSAVGRAFAGLNSELPVYSGPGGGAIEAIFVRAVQDAFTPTLQEWVDGHTDEIMDGLKPLIRAWMDEHLPPLIEAAVHREISRAANSRKR